MKKKIRIILIASVAYFIVWFVQLIAFVFLNPETDIATPMPTFLKVQIGILVAAWLIILTISCIYWHKFIAQEIKTFINE